ncbi:MAG TPA: pilus assembly protein N-terminal domain-containing protein [Hyalangium sp.]|nr:pilus assembly protein N-terminal domain-containing protein [Hyalangium sp.]
MPLGGWRIGYLVLVLGASPAWAQGDWIDNPKVIGQIEHSSLGSSSYLHLEGFDRVAVEDPAVAVVVAKGTQVEYICTGYGKTRIRAWKKTGELSQWDLNVAPAPEEGPKASDSALLRRGAVEANKRSARRYFRKAGEVSVGVGEEKEFSVPGLEVFNPGDDPVVADFRSVGPERMLVYGMAPGVVQLRVWTRSGEKVAYYVTIGDGQRRAEPAAAGVFGVGDTVTVVEGADQELPVKVGVRSVHVATPGIAEARGQRGDRAVRIRGVRAGNTILHVLNDKGQRITHLIRVEK